MMEKKKAVVPLVCHGHSRPVVDLFYSPITPDGFFLISASKDSTPMLRSGETGDWIGTFEGHKGAVWSCCLDKYALRGASASADFSAKIWDALTGDVLHSFDHKHIVRACAFSEDTHLLLTGGMEKILRIFDLNRPDAPPTEVNRSPSSIRTVAWLHNDQTILSSCGDIGGVSLCDVRSGEIVRTLETKFPVTSAEVSQDGRYITTADGSSVKFWDATQFGLVKNYDMPCNVESASLEPKLGNKFVAGGEDLWIHIFDFNSGEEIGCNKGHHGPVHCLRFSPGGESYASGSEDGTIRIWKMVSNNNDQDMLLASLPSETSLDNGASAAAKDEQDQIPLDNAHAVQVNDEEQESDRLDNNALAASAENEQDKSFRNSPVADTKDEEDKSSLEHNNHRTEDGHESLAFVDSAPSPDAAKDDDEGIHVDSNSAVDKTDELHEETSTADATKDQETPPFNVPNPCDGDGDDDEIYLDSRPDIEVEEPTDEVAEKIDRHYSN